MLLHVENSKPQLVNLSIIAYSKYYFQPFIFRPLHILSEEFLYLSPVKVETIVYLEVVKCKCFRLSGSHISHIVCGLYAGVSKRRESF